MLYTLSFINDLTEISLTVRFKSFKNENITYRTQNFQTLSKECVIKSFDKKKHTCTEKCFG